MAISALPPQEEAQSQSSADFISNNTVKLAGIGQLIGDTALLAYGAATRDMKIGSVGALGYTAGIVGTRYGNPKAEQQVELAERKLGDFLRQQGIAIPENPDMEKLRQPGGIIDNVESFLYTYPTQVINGCFTLMGVQFARSGIQNSKTMLTASGALMMAAGLSGLLIQEQKPDPRHPPQGVLEKAISWVKEKPLRLTSVLANLNQVTLAMDALQERKDNPGKKAYLFKLLAVAGFVMCNTMLGLSSKGEGGGAAMDEEARNALADTAARVIAAQPKEVQAAVLNEVSVFLSMQPNVQMKAKEISTLLEQKVAEAGKGLSPWQQRQGQANMAAIQK